MKKLAILILALAVLMTVQSSVLRIPKNSFDSAHPSNSPFNFKEIGLFNGKFRGIETQKGSESKNDNVVQAQQEEQQQSMKELSDSRNDSPKSQDNETEESDSSEDDRLVKNLDNFIQQLRKDTGKDYNETGKKNVRLLQFNKLNAQTPIQNVKLNPEALKAYTKLLTNISVKDSNVQIISAFYQVTNGIVYTFKLKIYNASNYYAINVYKVHCQPNNIVTFSKVATGLAKKQDMSFSVKNVINLQSNMIRTKNKEDLKCYNDLNNQFLQQLDRKHGKFEFISAYYYNNFYIVKLKIVKYNLLITSKLLHFPCVSPCSKIQFIDINYQLIK